MRTYDKLQSWHYSEIERSGWKVGDDCFIHDEFDGFVKAKITEFKLHWTGEDILMAEVEWIDESEYKDPENVWSADGNNINKSVSKRHTTVYFGELKRSCQESINYRIAKLNREIQSRESEIEYRKKEIKKLKGLDPFD